MEKEVMSKEKLEELRARLEVARLKKQVKKTETQAEAGKKKYTYSDGALERRKEKNIENLIKKNKDKVKEILGETETVEKVEKVDDSKKEIKEKKKETEEVEQIEIKKLIEPIRSQPIDIPTRKNEKKEKFMKLVYYKEPSAKVLKKLGKIQESSSESDSSSEEEIKPQVQQVQFNENDYYRQLARKLYY